MKILNLNLYFYPDSIGGATVVAEKMAWGFAQAGHEVTNVFLSGRGAANDLTTWETPFGRTVAINNVIPGPANRFSNPVASSLLTEIADIVQPDMIFAHAVQSLGIQDFLRDPKWLSRTRIIAHDFFWSCIQGFRTLPDGSRCRREIGPLSCRECAWFPGLIDETYRSAWHVLSNCHAVIFPSQFLHDGYAGIYQQTLPHFTVQSNPDQAEMIIPATTQLPEPAGLDARRQGKTVYGFVGGPGETKGWGLVQQFMDQAEQRGDSHVVLFDIGRGVERPWYGADSRDCVTIADPFHWSYAGHALGQVDVLLMPSNVQESFGLAAREILSIGGKAVIRRSGALAEIEGFADVVICEEGEDAADVTSKLSQDTAEGRPSWAPTSIAEYVERMLVL